MRRLASVLVFPLLFSLLVVDFRPCFGAQDTPKTEASAVYEHAVPSVVLITCADAAGNLSLGSGVILRADGVIATNYHVIDGATEARVKLRNGDIYDAVTLLDS